MTAYSKNCFKHQYRVAGVSEKTLKMAFSPSLMPSLSKSRRTNKMSALLCTLGTLVPPRRRAYTLKIKDEVGAGADLKDIA